MYKEFDKRVDEILANLTLKQKNRSVESGSAAV